MRKIIYALLLCLMAANGRSSAREGLSEYLLDDFRESFVYYKDGRIFSVKANYNLIRNAFMFIDENDNNQVKLFAEPELVRVVKVDNRLFQLDTKGRAQEILNREPYLAVTYKGRSRLQGKQVGYGGRSETASVDSYSSLQSKGYSYKLETEKIILTDIEKRYTIKRDRRQKQFQSAKQFLKLYPKGEEEAIATYIKDNKIDFGEPQQVLQLVRYAETL